MLNAVEMVLQRGASAAPSPDATFELNVQLTQLLTRAPHQPPAMVDKRQGKCHTKRQNTNYSLVAGLRKLLDVLQCSPDGPFWSIRLRNELIIAELGERWSRGSEASVSFYGI